MQTVKSCCFKFSLKDGTLALLISDLISQVIIFIFLISLKSDLLVKILIIFCSIFAVTVPIVGILGVLKENPKWLVPYLATQFIGVVNCVILLVVLVFGGPSMLNKITEALTSDPDGKGGKPGDATVGTVFLIEILTVIAAGHMYYFFVVVLSYYKKLQRESQTTEVQDV